MLGTTESRGNHRLNSPENGLSEFVLSQSMKAIIWSSIEVNLGKIDG
jgi:hypothetical protein